MSTSVDLDPLTLLTSQLTPLPSVRRAYGAIAPVPDTPRHGPWTPAGATASGALKTWPLRSPGPPPAGAACPSQPQCPPCR